MNDQSRKRELQTQYKESRADAGVYRIVNARSQRAFLASTTNLGSVQNRFAWAKSTSTASALDRRLIADFRQFGADAFTLEILETVRPQPEMTDSELRSELATLEALWRERFDPADLY